MALIRSDFIFSYWIFLWFILYIIQIVPYSPKFVIILGILENIILFILMIVYNAPYNKIIKFVIINTLIKIIPLVIVWRDKIKCQDIYATVIYFLIYMIWLHYNRINPYKIYRRLLRPYIYNNNKDKTLLSSLYNRLIVNIKKN
jgi:hypothetical protein